MYISMNWIGDFVDLKGLDKEALIKRFTLSTAEVEDIIYKGEDLKDVVSAKILTVEDIPESRKLHMLTVDAGSKIYDVVCGAPNVRPGMVIPFVKEGGRVGDMEIGCATLAGHESHGMCCSERELGISDEHAGLMELPEDTALGVDITDLYDIKDIVFEVDNKSLTNRPDLWGHYGIAREMAAIAGRELRPIDRMDLSAFDGLSPVDIQILDQEHCFRYSGLKVRNIKKKISPANMRIRLFYAGSRSINLLADLTNYLMLELGQPMHAFDCAKVDSICVKRYDKEFDFQTLDGETRKIDENTLMITCKDEPVAIAGIMGGLSSEIEDGTDSLLLESANFDAVSVRKSSTRLGLRTDASARYEKTLDPEMTILAVERFMQLLTEIDPGAEVISSLSDQYVKRYPEIDITFDKAYVDLYTGIDISKEQILSTLTSLGFETSEENGALKTKVPSWRRTKDVTLKADIIEEITRIYGYDNFEIKSTHSLLNPVKRTAVNLCDNYAKDILVEKYGLHEVQSYIWSDSKKYREIGIEPEPGIKLLNAMTPEHDTLRISMIPTLLSFTDENKAYAADFGIFEIGRTAEGLKEDGSCNERKKLGIVLFSRTRSEKELFFALLETVQTLCYAIKHQEPVLENVAAQKQWEHPRNTADIRLGSRSLGRLTAIHPTISGQIDKKAAVVAVEIDMMDFAAVPAADILYREPSKFPGINVDLSVVVNREETYRRLSAAWAEEPRDILSSVQVIDTFDMGSECSVTLRFAFSSNKKTLSREEIQPMVDRVIANLSGLGASLKL